MTPTPAHVPHPPRWLDAPLRVALPSDALREAILGDLHEEFQLDVQTLGERTARLRHLSRAVGIVLHALTDAAIRRAWAEGDSSADAAQGSSPPWAPASTSASVAPAGAGRWRAAAQVGGCTALALLVLVVGIVANTMLFSAAQLGGARVSSAAGAGGIAVLLASVVLAVMLVCLGPRWLRRSARGT